MMRWLLDRLPSDEIHVDGEVYMRRYYLFNPRKKHTKRFMIRLHEILLPDPGRDLHDHPFDFLSVVIKGGYQEQMLDYSVNTRKRWSVAFRAAEVFHRISFLLPNTWTLVFTGRIRRDWGFWTPLGWTHWRDYDEMTGNDSGQYAA